MKIKIECKKMKKTKIYPYKVTNLILFILHQKGYRKEIKAINLITISQTKFLLKFKIL